MCDVTKAGMQNFGWQNQMPANNSISSRTKSFTAGPLKTARDIYALPCGYLQPDVKEGVTASDSYCRSFVDHNIPAEAGRPCVHARLAPTKPLFVVALKVAASGPISCDWRCHIQHMHYSKGWLWANWGEISPHNPRLWWGKRGLSDVFTEATVGAGVKHRQSQCHVRQRESCTSAIDVTWTATLRAVAPQTRKVMGLIIMPRDSFTW